jgi:hypothetical protein
VGAPGQYSVKQMNVEFMLKYRGLSVQTENHWKNVYDNIRLTDTSMRGSYFEPGYFPHHVWKAFPKEVELSYRYAFVDGAIGVPNDLRQEHTVGLNVFLEGHTNKLTIDASRLALARAAPTGLRDYRYRVQWDVHF